MLRELVHALRRPAGRHCLDLPQPGQLPAYEFDPDYDWDAAAELDAGLPAGEPLPEDVLAPALLELDHAHPPLTPPEYSRRDEWPYTLRAL